MSVTATEAAKTLGRTLNWVCRYVSGEKPGSGHDWRIGRVELARLAVRSALLRLVAADTSGGDRPRVLDSADRFMAALADFETAWFWSGNESFAAVWDGETLFVSLYPMAHVSTILSAGKAAVVVPVGRIARDVAAGVVDGE